MSTTSSATGFIDLPAELRNQIYRLALVHDNPITLSRIKVRDVQKVDANAIRDRVLRDMGLDPITIASSDAVEFHRLHAAFSQVMTVERIRVNKHKKAAKFEYKL